MNAAAKRPTRGGPPLSADDAHRRLPLVRAIVADIVTLHRDLADRRDRLDHIKKLPGGKRHEDSVYSEELRQVEYEIGRDEQTLRGFVAELENVGGRLRDPEDGRVEFAGRHEGRDVYFGWRSGDDDLAYWRPLGSEESDRRPILHGSAATPDPETN